ncbi:hypothetical protein BJ138DRAFT_668705 [Hygrophoropsis aurantiaca]|uniref:Uncharacterized protein n=1 Tax=Hygrophoropsis aurantiaca TaxID=72124 RepID=A0ACB8AIY1_9AGAM|nr:hypothetical protein BJ138DRAFT_668705 [Hygrophoropsis aurantiaca]
MIVDANIIKKKKERREKLNEHAKVKTHDGKKDKGKARAIEANSEFRVIKASLMVSIAPVFANNLRGGVEEMLDSMVMRYIPAFRGVVLAHSNLCFLNKTATINADCPFSICPVGFDTTVWSPHVSMKLVGKVNLCSPDHVSLLVHRTFNVSIPKHHLPEDQWEFEYGPAENDPIFGAGAEAPQQHNPSGEHGVAEDSTEIGVVDLPQSPAENEAHGDEGNGRWVHRLTGTKLGGQDGYLEFTVIGLTVANEMLSLQGSIQPDPFSPRHVPRPIVPSKPSEPILDHSEDRDIDELDHENDDEGDDDEDMDPFSELAQMAKQEEEAAKRQKEAEAEVIEREKREKKERKRKQKEANEEGTVRDGEERAGGKKAKRKRALV